MTPMRQYSSISIPHLFPLTSLGRFFRGAYVMDPKEDTAQFNPAYWVLGRTSAVTILGMTSGRPQLESGIIKAPPRGGKTARVLTSWQINLYSLAHRRADALGRHNSNTTEKSLRNVTGGSLCRKVEVLRQFSGHDVLMRLVKGRGIELYIAV